MIIYNYISYALALLLCTYIVCGSILRFFKYNSIADRFYPSTGGDGNVGLQCLFFIVLLTIIYDTFNFKSDEPIVCGVGVAFLILGVIIMALMVITCLLYEVIAKVRNNFPER